MDLIDPSFRRESGRLTASLVRSFGVQHVDLAEDVVQETFLRAMREWPIKGIPAQPGAWLARVARNLAIDHLRRGKPLVGPEYLEDVASLNDQVGMDDELRLLFLCANPVLPEESQIAMILKLSSGFGVSEIGKALLMNDAAVAQRLVRAKRQLRDQGAILDLPQGDALAQRTRLVLKALYLTFNEGYAMRGGPDLTNADICDEAIRLVNLVLHSGVGDASEQRALLALMLLHSARLPARADSQGRLQLLEHQDRAKWDRGRIEGGMACLALSLGTRMTPYHCEAAIAAEHCLASSYAETNWCAVLANYNDLMAIAPGPIAALNRAVAVSMASGAAEGLDELNRLSHDRHLQRYYLYHASQARMLESLGRLEEGWRSYLRAAELAVNPAESAFLCDRIDSLARKIESERCTAGTK